MRKLLLSVCVFAITALSSFAQTQDSPLALTTGENNYTNANFQNKTVVYYSYANSTGSDQVLVLNTETASTSFAVTCEGSAVVHSEQNNSQVFEVAKDKTVLIKIETYSKKLSFNASLIKTDLTTNLMILPSKGEDVYLPSRNGNPITATYTANETGLLCIAFNHAQTAYPSWEDEDGNSQTFGYESDFDGNKQYVGKFLVVAGKTYTITFNNAVPDLLNIYVDTADDGTTIDGPFVGVIGENTLPAKAGHYYYSFERADYIGHRWMMFDSDTTIPGGSLRVYTSTTDSQPTYSVNNYIAGRMHVETSADNYYIRIEKKADTQADEKFTISLNNDLLDVDSVETCPTVEVGKSYNVPHYNGTYYYKISVPSDLETKYLVVDGSEKGMNSTVMVGPSYQYESYVAKSTNGKVRAIVSPGEEYVITWKPNEGINDFPFTVSYEDIVPGETESAPLEAEVGTEYTIPAGEQIRYFKHMATKNCWIEAHVSDLDATVVFKKMGYTNITVASQKKENVYRLRALEGESYLMVVTSADYNVTLTVVETELGNGESADKALPIDLGTTNLTNEEQDIWYVYTAEKNGMLEVKSDIEFESDPMNPSKGSDVAVRIGSTTADDQSIMSYDSSWNLCYDKEFAVEEGQEVYIHVKTYSAQKDKTISLSMREYNEGESPMKPIELKVGENILPTANSLYGYYWYAMDLGVGYIQIDPKNGQAFNFDMYNENDLTTTVATTQRETTDDAYTYELLYYVREAGRYLFHLTRSQEGDVVIVEGTAAGINDINVNVNDDENIYNISGQRVNDGFKGIIIKNGKKIIKK